jgi:hypothetical protein
VTVEELRGIFYDERDAFAEAIPRAARARLHIRKRPAGAAPRDFAYCDTWSNGDIDVTLFEEMCRLPLLCVLGVIRHELGHVCDPIEDSECDGEARADEIAELVTGTPIRYTAAGVQTIGRGGERPSWILC